MSKPRRNSAFGNQAMRNLNSAANSGMKVADKAASGLFRWMVTNHSGVQFYLPTGLGFFDTIRHMLTFLLVATLYYCLGAIALFLMIAYGIPFLIMGHL